LSFIWPQIERAALFSIFQKKKKKKKEDEAKKVAKGRGGGEIDT